MSKHEARSSFKESLQFEILFEKWNLSVKGYGERSEIIGKQIRFLGIASFI